MPHNTNSQSGPETMVCHMNKCYTVEALLATSSSYDHLYETPFELWLKLCDEKLS